MCWAIWWQYGKSGLVSLWRDKVQDQCSWDGILQKSWKSVGEDKGLMKAVLLNLFKSLTTYQDKASSQCYSNRLWAFQFSKWSFPSTWSWFQSFFTFPRYLCSGKCALVSITFPLSPKILPSNSTPAQNTVIIHIVIITRCQTPSGSRPGSSWSS